MTKINKVHIEQALQHIEAHPNEYKQSAWCGTACCVWGWARHFAGTTQASGPPRVDEYEHTPYMRGVLGLVGCSSDLVPLLINRVCDDGHVNLAGVNLTGANLAGADFTGAGFIGADLTGANLTGVDFGEANLTGANLTKANLTGANLTEADLTKANLTEADLTEADLAWANLTEADLTGADLTGADIIGADLTGSVGAYRQ